MWVQEDRQGPGQTDLKGTLIKLSDDFSSRILICPAFIQCWTQEIFTISVYIDWCRAPHLIYNWHFMLESWFFVGSDCDHTGVSETTLKRDT